MAGEPTPVSDYLCLGCACLCDDLRVETSGFAIVAAERACDLGRAWLKMEAERTEELAAAPIATVDGRPAHLDEAIATVAHRLRAGRSPLILLRDVSCEAASQAVGLADRIGGAIDRRPTSEAPLSAFARDGAVGATLGEVRDRSDLVVYWACDPANYPRHRDRFVPERPWRTVVDIVAASAWARGRPKDEVEVVALPLDSGELAEVFALLRMMLRGKVPDRTRVEEALGVEFDALSELASRLSSAKHGAFILGDLDEIERGEAHRLVRDLNQCRRFVAVDIGGSQNEAGIDAATTWSAGAPRSVDFGDGSPRYRPFELSRRLRTREYDRLIVIGAPLAYEERAPFDVWIGPGATIETTGVAINAARVGLDDGGTVIRCDGLALPARPIVSTERPAVSEVLRSLNALFDAEVGRP